MSDGDADEPIETDEFPGLPKNDPRRIPAMRERMWKPGQSGNLAGPPRRKTLEEIVGRLLEEQMTMDGKVVSGMEALGAVVLHEAMQRRNDKVLKELLARLWPTTVNVNAQGSVVVVFDDQDRREMEAIRDE